MRSENRRGMNWEDDGIRGREVGTREGDGRCDKNALYICMKML